MILGTPNENLNSANEKVLASVGGKQITSADVDAMITSMGQNGATYNTPQGRAAILEELIAQKLMLLDATRNLYEREPAFKDRLNRAKENLLIDYAIEKTISSVRVTDDEAKEYYDAHPEQFDGQEQVSASHILVDDEAQAQALLEQIRAGEISFEEAAGKYSKCPSSQNGGSLGEFGRGQMVPEFDDACFSMNVGELRGPVKTQFGYHLIRLDSKGTSEKLAFSDVRDAIKRKLTMEKQQAAYRSKVNQLKILYPVDQF